MSVLVSVVTITYNIINAGRKEFLRQCFESVNNQTYKNIEHIVIDGASTDGTVDLLREYTEKGWITYYSEPDTGIYDAMNKGIDRASGKYIAFLNSDDFWHDLRGVEESVKYLEREQADFSYATCYYLDENDQYIGCLKPFLGSFYVRMPFSHQTMFTRREKMLELGKFNDKLKIVADCDFVTRLILSGAKAVRIPLNFTSYRFIGLSTVQSTNSAVENLALMERIFQQYGFTIEDAHNCWNFKINKGFVQKIKKDLHSTTINEVDRILSFCSLNNNGYYLNNFVPLPKKIKIIYDATLLGNFFRNNNARTGIFFVVYNILVELLKRFELEVYVYCEEHAKPDLLHVISKFPNEFSNLKFYDGNILNFDIFFSPVFKIPDAIRNSGICCFTYLYDLIAILFPEFNNEASNKNSWFMQLINSLDYDDYIFTISDWTKKDVINTLNKIDPKKITTALLAANDTFYQDLDEEKHRRIREKYTIPPDKKYVFSLCTLEPRKNLVFTVKNFIKFIEKNKIEDLVFVLGGGAWDSFIGQLDAAIDNLEKYKEKIIKTGYIDDCDLASLYSHAECTAYMSLYEGFGLPPLEAMQCGCPVIASKTSSLPEVVGDAAIMVAPHDDEAMIKAFEEIYFNKDVQKELVVNGLERAKRFSWKKTVDVMTNTFMSVDTVRKVKMMKTVVKLFGIIPIMTIEECGNDKNVMLFNSIRYTKKQ